MKYIKKIEKVLDSKFSYFSGNEVEIDRYDDKHIIVSKQCFSEYDEYDNLVCCKVRFVMELNDNNIISSLEDIENEMIIEANNLIDDYSKEYISAYYIFDNKNEIEIKKVDIIRKKLYSYTYKDIFTEDKENIKEKYIKIINKKINTLDETLIEMCSELANIIKTCSEQEKTLAGHIDLNTIELFKNSNKKKIESFKKRVNKVSEERNNLLKKINM